MIRPGLDWTRGGCQGCNHCPGGGLPQKCENEGGEKITLVAAMRAHWQLLGFTPDDFELEMP